MTAVALDSLTKRFNTGRGATVRAVDDLTLTARRGELLVLLGPSGCGKTTTLRLIAGLEQPTSGTIHIGDRIVNRLAPKDRDVAMVFQNYALYPHMTVLKNLSFGLKMRRVPKAQIRRKVGEIADQLGLTSVLDRKPAALSGGECQRVALGRAIVRTPKVFLFDEPLSNLDAPQRLRTRTELKSLQRRLATTTIHVTHDQEEAMVLGDRIAVLDRGAVRQVGSPADLYRRPENRFVAGFIGTPAMNFLTGRIEGDAGACCFTSHAVRLNLAAPTARRLDGSLHRDVILGIRPEHVLVEPWDDESRQVDQSTSAPAGASLTATPVTVVGVEMPGDRMNARLALPNGEPLTARLSPETTIATNRQVRLRVNLDNLHFFSADDGGQRLA